MLELITKRQVIILSLVTIICMIIGLRYRSCYGIACSESGEMAVGMKNPFTRTEYIFFYDKDQGLRTVTNFRSDDNIQTGRRRRPSMYFNADHIIVYSKPVGYIHYNYKGVKISVDAESDKKVQKAGYYYETQGGGTVKWENRFGFEHITVQKADGSSKEINFTKYFLLKILRGVEIPVLVLLILTSYTYNRHNKTNDE